MAPSFVQAAVSVLLASSAVWAEGDSMYGRELFKRDPVPSEDLPGTWKYQGCYRDGAPRTLSGPTYANGTGMTAKSCIAFCDNANYIYAGTEYSSECYCGNGFGTGGTVADATDCNMPCSGNATEACGGPNRLSVFWNGSDPPPGPSHNPGTQGYGLLGCYTEGTGGRALTFSPAITGDLTIAKCITACRTAGYTFAGAEYAQECYCGNAISNGADEAPEGLAGCSMTCKGNSTEFCGAGNRLDVYKLGFSGSSSTLPAPSSTTTTTRTSTLTSSAGTSRTSSSTTRTTTTTRVSTTSTTRSSTTTRSSSTTSRSSSSTTRSSSSTTRASSSTTRSSSSTTTRTSSSTVRSSSSLSSTATSASASPTLSRKPVVGAYTRQGCFTETQNGRALPQAAFYSYDAMTLEYCASSCAAYVYWGVEYGGECFCGNDLNPLSTQALDTDCDFRCPGDPNEYCGAGNRLELYKRTSSVSSTSSGPVSSTTTRSSTLTSPVSTSLGSSTSTTRTSTTTSAVPSVSGLPAGWKYAGCYKEGTTGRAITFQQDGFATTNSVNNCINACIAKGYTVAGLEYSEQCFCDNAIHNGGVPTNDETRCSMTCSGNPNEKCGAGDILSVYNSGELKVYQPPAAQKTDLPGSWEYVGCWTDNVGGKRSMPWQVILANNNSATNCLGICSKFGFMSAGMQYGEECFCGDHEEIIAAGAGPAPETDCQTLCSGDKNYYCGGGVRNSYYRWTGAPLYEFGKPTGGAAGSYEFFIGGKVVPLITTLGINDKAMFLEKSGTGAPNATGVYELDFTNPGDFEGSWRELRVETDIFCAAGITLPDKAGRQLNVGGWSGDSTFGVRVYTPSGSAGVAGTTNWVEDNANVRLLDGRWYPTALQLTNGSILVIGGEIGSNSAPTPTLEIIPRPAGATSLYMDWLFRTDPNNLYPFMWILPSGGIFIIYYNEARILDEKTFATTKVLPNAPGSPNNFLAGRTYPLEGTGVMFPLYPPYLAAATFLACGGSAAGNGQALDNCVSISPESANAQWTIERMPSKRVLTCMTALPDGTFLILNGAKQGVAGFGLANTPNKQAVLYNPQLDVGKRMSIMASTTIARMYHSEAILMPDGRVMVSGSNPEDGVNPEEYRVEVFSPPYALNGLPKPIWSFTTNKDWAYGVDTVRIQTTIPSGNAGGIRVSMNAAVSSTHGNSMGQRTIFLAVSCTGAGVCSVTTPPSATVAPPGWYQIFVLDGPTPGRGIWVRIGGSIADAAGIGNWPANSAKFVKPGLGPAFP